MFRAVAIALTMLGISCFLAYRSADANWSVNGDANALESFVGQADFEKLTPRLETLNRDIATKGLHDFPEADGKMLTGYAYGEFYDWDLYFENVYLSYYGVSTYDFINFKVFLDRQQPDGFVSRTIGIKQNGDNYEWLRARYYERLKKYLDRWFAYDTDGNGLPVWNSSDASGMDNQISRSGQPDSYQDEGVDLACYLYRELQAMQIIAKKLGRPDDARAYAEHARLLAAAINRVFWDNKDGFYYDRNQKTGQPIRVKSVAGFLPLWAGVASREQARRLVREHLTNPREFWLKYPVATYAMTEPDFFEGTRGGCNWRGPAWIPTNYMILHGLMDYGFKTEARELALKTFEMALDENPVTREYYDSDTGEGNGMNPFWGWSSLAYVMPLDVVEHYDPMDLRGAPRPLLRQDLDLSFVESK